MCDKVKTVLLIGASGFIGKNLKNVLKNQYEVIEFDRKKYSLNQLSNFLAENNIDLIINAAGKINGGLNELKQGNVLIVDKIIAALTKLDSGIRLIHLSSVSAVNPINNYGFTKSEGEQVIMSSDYKNWTILRPTLIYGAGDSKNIGSIIKLASISPILPVFVGENIKLQPLFVEDLAKYIIAIILTNNFNGKAYTVGGLKQYSLVELVKIIKPSLMIIPIPISFVHLVIKFGKIFLPERFIFTQISTLDRQPFLRLNRDKKSMRYRASFNRKCNCKGIKLRCAVLLAITQRILQRRQSKQ